MENLHISLIKHKLSILENIAEHSRTMSVGAKILICKQCNEIRNELELVELELMNKK